MQIKCLMSSLFLISLAFIVAAAAPGYSAAFTNGGFEASSPGWTGTYQPQNAGSTTIPGWTVTFGSVDWINTYWQNAEGSYSIDLSGTSLGQISQTFGTQIGQPYKVTFAMAGNPDGGGDAIKDLLSVVVGGAVSQIFSFVTTGKSTADMDWEDRVFLFTALTTSTTLQFTGLEGNAYGAAIDNVRVEAVPVPAAAWMLGTGLIGLVALRRKFN